MYTTYLLSESIVCTKALSVNPKKPRSKYPTHERENERRVVIIRARRASFREEMGNAGSFALPTSSSLYLF